MYNEIFQKLQVVMLPTGFTCKYQHSEKGKEHLIIMNLVLDLQTL